MLDYPMFKKACFFDEQTCFYFDTSDNKWLAQGGSVAWRTNNPGLLQTHQLIRHVPIGHLHRVVIFPSIKTGIAALYLWLLQGDFKSQFLSKIAHHLQPNSPQRCLEQLCDLTRLQECFSRSHMTGEELAKIVQAIKKITSFVEFQEKEFFKLPKISARYYSEDKKVDHFLTSTNELLQKSIAIQWVEEHRLDAVIVHKKNGSLYLRARPAHHLDRIQFSSEEYVQENDFDHAIRDVGSFQEGQCIWGFINGIWNSDDHATKSAQLISEVARNQKVWSLINNWSIFDDSGLTQCIEQKCDIETRTVKNKPLLPLLVNITVLDENKKWLRLEHSFETPCYRNKLKDIIYKYIDESSHQLDGLKSELIFSI